MRIWPQNHVPDWLGRVVMQTGENFLFVAIRLWLAVIFLTHGLNGLLQPGGDDGRAVVEIVTAILLAVGLGTRVSALIIAYLSIFVYVRIFDVSGHLFCALLAMVLVTHGAGPLSVDASIAKGVRMAPLPMVRTFSWLIDMLDRWMEAALRCLLRLWLALLFAVAGGIDLPPVLAALVGDEIVNPVVMQTLAENAPFQAVWLVGAASFILGFAVRPVALILLVLVIRVWAVGAGLPEHLMMGLILFYLVAAGAGPVSLDRAMTRWRTQDRPAAPRPSTSRIVIVGGGFGGLAAARALRSPGVSVTLIDRRNYHLFQPLLYQVATAMLSPAEIAVPIRALMRDRPNVDVRYGEVSSVDTENRNVMIGTDAVPYDYLVLATGARHDYFGNDGWDRLAPGLKKIEDATDVRRRILLSFERAENARSDEERRRHLTFVIVGAGPTGVELAGAIAELAHRGMERDFRRIDPSEAQVILVQSGKRILPAFPEDLASFASRRLEKAGVTVRTGSRVMEIDQTGVDIGGERIAAGVVLWAAGVRASRAAKWLNCSADRAGRAIVGPDLSVPGHPDVFVIGDTAAIRADDSFVPGLAPAAKQAGSYVARVILSRIKNQPAPEPFVYNDLGNLATIGRDAAIADFGRIRLAGRLAWWFWGVVHILFLLGGRNRLVVLLSWAWSYLTFRQSTRLITGPADAPVAEARRSPQPSHPGEAAALNP